MYQCPPKKYHAFLNQLLFINKMFIEQKSNLFQRMKNYQCFMHAKTSSLKGLLEDVFEV